MESRSSPEPQLLRQERVGEYIDESPGNDQILFDLSLFGPRGGITPFDNVLAWDHSSASGSRRTTTCHLLSRSIGAGAKSGSLASLLSSSTHGGFPRVNSILRIF